MKQTVNQTKDIKNENDEVTCKTMCTNYCTLSQKDIISKSSQHGTIQCLTRCFITRGRTLIDHSGPNRS